MNNTTDNSKTNNTEIGNNINRSSQLNANNDQHTNLKSQSIYRRLLPGLLMLLLGVALATTGVVSEVSAQNTVADWVSYMPANGGQQLDNNGDGTVDFINYDTNGDGLVEAARGDSNLDGYLEAVMLDTDRNGVFNEVIYDNNLDGVLETAVVDSNQDGTFDMVGYDLNGTGSYSGWTSYSPPAQQGGGTTVSIGYDIPIGIDPSAQPGGGAIVSVGWSSEFIAAVITESEMNWLRNQFPSIFGTGGSSGVDGTGGSSGGDAWFQPGPRGTSYDPVAPSDYGTYHDPYRHSRTDGNGNLYSTGRRPY